MRRKVIDLRRVSVTLLVNCLYPFRVAWGRILAEVEMLEQNASPRTITATEMRRNFSAVIRRMRRRREHTIIQSSGESVAVLLPIAEYERLMKSERLAALDDLARNLGRQVEQRGLTEDELMAELEETKRQVFTERYGRPA